MPKWSHLSSGGEGCPAPGVGVSLEGHRELNLCSQLMEVINPQVRRGTACGSGFEEQQSLGRCRVKERRISRRLILTFIS